MSTQSRNIERFVFVTVLVAAATGYAVLRGDAATESSQLSRGKYLVQVAGCTDCHTPGHLLGKPDMSRFLGGSDVGFEVPGLGTFVGPNLTPDAATGLGNWTGEQITTAPQTGVRPDGRMLAPTMPWRAYAVLTKPDAVAIVAYLKNFRRSATRCRVRSAPMRSRQFHA